MEAVYTLLTYNLYNSIFETYNTIKHYYLTKNELCNVNLHNPY